MTFLDNVDSIDWTNFEKAATTTKNIVRALASDKDSLRKLVYQIEDNETLMAQCECHQLQERLVIYDGGDRNFKIRLNFSTEEHFDRPHDHRFSFTTLILKGSYRHIWYRHDGDIYDESMDGQARQWMDRFNPDNISDINLTGIKPLFVTDEKQDTCYTMHHSVIHATITTPGTLSLFLKGPAEKTRSLIADKATGKLWWRYGAADETPERRKQKLMSNETYKKLRERLESWKII